MPISPSRYQVEESNIYDLVQASMRMSSNRPALRLDDRTVTYHDLQQLVDRLSVALVSRGLGPGDHVAGMVSKTPEAIAFFLATVRVGAIYIPVNVGFTERELDHILDDACPRLVVADGTAAARFTARSAVELGDLLSRGDPDPAPPVAPGGTRTCAMLFTSGTTGKPKGALMSHAGMCATFTTFNEIWGINESDRFLHVLPIFHAHGLLMALLCPFFAGAEIRLLPKFNLETVLTELPNATAMMAVPTIWSRLAEHPRFTRSACRNLRLATSGSAPFSPELYDRLLEKAGVEVLDRYGSTEAGMVAANPVGGSRRGSVGRPLAGVELRITDNAGAALPTDEIGRIQVRGHHVFSGYWNRPDLEGQGFTADGFFDTGDFGRLSGDGYLHIVGRDRDMIISGGYNVYPREIEIALEELDAIKEAAVFAVPHPDFGEGVVAAVLMADASEFDEKTIIDALSERLAAYKRPKRVFRVEEFPRNAMGKVVRAGLKDQFGDSFKPRYSTD